MVRGRGGRWTGRFHLILVVDLCVSFFQIIVLCTVVLQKPYNARFFLKTRSCSIEEVSIRMTLVLKALNIM